MGGEIVTGYDEGYRPVAELTVPVMRRYAERHGFAFTIAHFEPGERAPAWSKITAIQEALARGSDPVVWIDADGLIVRQHVDIRSALSPDREVFMVRESATPISYASTAVVVVRNTAWATQFFDRIWQSQLSPEHVWWDQAAFLHLIGERAILKRGEQDCPNHELLSHIGWLDERWNYTMSWSPVRAPFIRHYSGMPNAARRALIRFDVLGGGDMTAMICRISRRVAFHQMRMQSKARAAAGIMGLVYRLRHGAARAAQAVLPKML